MHTKNLNTKQLAGVATSTLIASHAEHEGQRRVLIHVRQFDKLGIGFVSNVHSMSVAEAEVLASKLAEAISLAKRESGGVL